MLPSPSSTIPKLSEDRLIHGIKLHKKLCCRRRSRDAAYSDQSMPQLLVFGNRYGMPFICSSCSDLMGSIAWFLFTGKIFSSSSDMPFGTSMTT
uniref:Uncharacterized protein n=1 Tax=Kalanchoe fedtschenkoi TaxID=63787 RepID=A0A7N0TKN6_KALFE